MTSQTVARRGRLSVVAAFSGAGRTAEVPEEPFNERRLLDAGDDAQPSAALPTDLEVDGEHAVVSPQVGAGLGTGAFRGAGVAADKLTNHLKPVTCTLYVRPNMTKQFIATAAERYRLRADLKGNIEILDAFWKFPTDPRWPDVVPAPLVHADLVATLDPRNLEVAELVRTQYLE